MEENGKDVVFIDAYNLIYRAFHGTPGNFKALDGTPTNAIFTVARMLNNLPERFNNITFALAVFDGAGGSDIRKELDPNYKATRKEMPEELKQQMPYIKKTFELLGWPILQAVDGEADDVIGTLAKRSAAKGFNTYIVSSDKDFFSIVTENLNVLNTMADICYTPDKVREKLGVGPENVTGWLALVGDGVDNVKGVDKIGKGSAPKFLNKYGNLQGLIDNKDAIKGKMGENLRAAIADGSLMTSLALVTLNTDLPIELKVKDVRMKEVDVTAWNDFCYDMNI